MGSSLVLDGSSTATKQVWVLTIPAGSSSVTVDLTADDETALALVEATETLTATITAVNDVAPDQDHALTVGAADEAVVTISDTDAATVSVSPATVTISEGGAAAALTFALRTCRTRPRW